MKCQTRALGATRWYRVLTAVEMIDWTLLRLPDIRDHQIPSGGQVLQRFVPPNGCFLGRLFFDRERVLVTSQPHCRDIGVPDTGVSARLIRLHPQFLSAREVTH